MDLGSDHVDKLIVKAIEVKNKAYAPYSNFRVGAALLTKTDEIYQGCNIENISYTPTVCAERTAIFTAISQGHYDFKAIAIVSDDSIPTPPCGVCRQVMSEFVEDDFQIILSTTDGEIKTYRFRDLFPDKFVPDRSIGAQDG